MNKIVFLLLFFTASAFAGPPPMKDIDPQYVQDKMSLHTKRVDASLHPNGFRIALTTLIDKTSIEGNGFMLRGLDNSDAELLQKADILNPEVMPLFKPYAEKMDAILRSDSVDTAELANLLSEARAAENEYKTKKAQSFIDKMSSAGKKAVMEAIELEANSLSYNELDIRALEDDVPEYIVFMANQFVSSLDRFERNRGKPQIKPDLSTKDWGVELK